ncbi:MAG TPA: ATP-binding cassette domain-containing protein, partial [Rugosimonospora sp.]|nr:ATP-binding cassette domain-containing protein [Rugosimonospora sp.]
RAPARLALRSHRAGRQHPGTAAVAWRQPDALRIDGLRYAYGETVAVDGVDLAVRPGEVYGLLGSNGAGKTTTIQAVTTLLKVPAGTVEVFGVDAALHKMAVRRLIGYVPQQLSADGALTGRENVALFARLFDVPRRVRRARTDEAIESMGLSAVANRTASTYSGGMVRRLELAQALVSSPRLLILDEPTIGLDPVARASVWQRIAAVRAETGMAVLVTTHYMDEAEQHCDRVALMHRGRIRAEGTPAALVASLGRVGQRLDDVFRVYTSLYAGPGRDEGGFRDVRVARATAQRVG